VALHLFVCTHIDFEQSCSGASLKCERFEYLLNLHNSYWFSAIQMGFFEMLVDLLM
jgi:hypothetical protein